MGNGWNGKLLRVNLSAMTCIIEDLNMAWAARYIGGRGLATKYLTEEVSVHVRPWKASIVSVSVQLN